MAREPDRRISSPSRQMPGGSWPSGMSLSPNAARTPVGRPTPSTVVPLTVTMNQDPVGDRCDPGHAGQDRMNMMTARQAAPGSGSPAMTGATWVR